LQVKGRKRSVPPMKRKLMVAGKGRKRSVPFMKRTV